MFQSPALLKYTYMVVLAVLGSASGAVLLMVAPWEWSWSVGLLLLAIGVAYTLADYYGVVFQLDGPDGKRKISVGVNEAPEVFALLVVGPLGIIPILLATLLTGRVLGQRGWQGKKPWKSVFYNVTNRTMTYLLSYAYLSLFVTNAMPATWDVGVFLGMLGLILLYPLWDTFTFGLVIATSWGRSVVQIWRNGVTLSEWVSAINVAMGAMAGVLYLVNPWLSLIAIAPIILARFATKAVITFVEESAKNRRLADALAQEKTRLEERVQERTQEIAHLLDLHVTETTAIVHDVRHRIEAIQQTTDLFLLLTPHESSQPILHDVQVRLRRAFYDVNALLREVSDAALMERGQVIMEPEAVDLHTLVHEVADQLRDRFTLLACTLELQPPAVSPLAWCDRNRIERVFYNLLDNASEYAAGYERRDGGDPRVTITFAVESALIACHITDNGPGIAAEDLQRLGQRGIRLQATPTTSAEHAGLGLHYVVQACHMNGGHLHIHSAGVGCGSTFTVSLPSAPRTSADVIDDVPPCTMTSLRSD